VLKALLEMADVFGQALRDTPGRAGEDVFPSAYARLGQPMDATRGDALALHPPPEWPDETIHTHASSATRLEGDLWTYFVSAPAGKRWQRRRFQLAPGKKLLNYYSSAGDDDGGGVNLSGAVVQRAHRREYCISITGGTDQGAEFFVAADTESEYQRWLSALAAVAAMDSSGSGAAQRLSRTTPPGLHQVQVEGISQPYPVSVVDSNPGCAGVSLPSTNGSTVATRTLMGSARYPAVSHPLPAVHPPWTAPEPVSVSQQESRMPDVEISRIQSLLRQSRSLHASSSSGSDVNSEHAQTITAAVAADVVGQLHVTLKESVNLQAQVPQVKLRLGNYHQVTPDTLPITQ
jgi:hypothetical protein